MKSLVGIAMILASSAAYCQGWGSESCGAALERAYTVFSVRPDATTQGDFNSDGQSDFAKLLDHKYQPGKAAVGICLSGVKKPLLITDPYQSTKIFTKPKGTAYMDFNTEKEGVYERDVVSVSDGTWFGSSYILRSGVFVEVIDGD